MRIHTTQAQKALREVRARRARLLWLALMVLLLGVTALLGSVAGHSVPSTYAATPPGGRLTDANRNLNWNGPTYATPSVIVDRQDQCDVPTSPCDEYGMYIDLPSGYTLTQQITVTVSITSPQTDNDYDLYILTPQGTVAASSSSPNAGETTAVICPSTGVTYTIQVVPSTVTDVPSTYSGKATLTTGPGTACAPNAGPVSGPPHTSGGLGFGPNVLVDPQRQVGEPDIAFPPMTAPHYLTDVLASGPWGTHNQQSFVWLSRDDGDTYHVVSKLRPDTSPGGGDTSTEIDDQDHYYFTDLEALQNFDVARSVDGGNTWQNSPVSEAHNAVDRQWMAIDNGPTNSASDNTYFFDYRQAALGSYLMSSTDSTFPVFVPASTGYPVTPINDGAPCGDLRFDPVLRYLYLPCGNGNHVQVSYAHVDPMQRTGITFTTSQTPAGIGDTSNLFPVLATDQAGNVYVTYVDSGDYNVYLTYSTDHAQTWSKPIRINGNTANTALFPWIVGGATGRVAVAYLATDKKDIPDNFPSWYNDPAGASTVKWYLYVNYIQQANTANPTIYQVQASEHPNHYGQVCTAGTLCAATGGDRTMADFLTIQHDNQGAIQVIYNDTTNQYHGASVFVAKQLAGPSLLGGTLNNSPAPNPVSDPTGDAQYPHYGTGAPGPNYDALDLKSVGVSSDASNVNVTMVVSNANATKILPGATSVEWLTRWQLKAPGDTPGEESYRIFYVGAKSTAGGAPSFFYGTGTVSTGPTVGCTDTQPQNCKVVNYPPENTATGTFNAANNTITVSIPRSFMGNPAVGEKMYSITAYTFGTRDTPSDFLDDVDVTRPFDYALAGGSQATPTATATAGGPPPAATSTPTAGPTSCPVQFRDVDPNNTFYPTIRCLACRGVMSGYQCGGPGEPCPGAYFRPGENVTRGQLAKIVSNSAGLADTPHGQSFQDVAPGAPFYPYIERLYSRGFITGYPCGTVASEPCVAPNNRPYFRPSNNATRGQISKIIANAAGYSQPVSGQTYQDVPPSNDVSSFYKYIERLTAAQVMSGYPCGQQPGEPCVGPNNRPYFRPGALASRGQTAKIDSNTFFPNCQTPARPANR